MIGSSHGFYKGGKLSLQNYIFSLQFTKTATILISLITGKFESWYSGTDHFDPISILGYHDNEWNYTLVSEAQWTLFWCLRVGIAQLEQHISISSLLKSLHSRSTGNCDPLGEVFNFLPPFVCLCLMSWSDVGKLQPYLPFLNLLSGTCSFSLQYDTGW